MKLEARKKRATELRDQGLTLKVIAKRLGVSPGAVQYYLKTTTTGKKNTKTVTEKTTVTSVVQHAEDMLAQAREYANRATDLETQAFYILGRDRYLADRAATKPVNERTTENKTQSTT